MVMVPSRLISTPIWILNTSTTSSTSSSQFQQATHSISDGQAEDADNTISYDSTSDAILPSVVDDHSRLSSSQASICSACFPSSDNSGGWILARFLPNSNNSLELRFLPSIDSSSSSSSSSSSHSSFTPQLDSLLNSPPPQYFNFPTSILPNIQLIPDLQHESLYVLLLSNNGILYRLRFNLPFLFNNPTYSDDWKYNYKVTAIANFGENESYRPTGLYAVDAGLVIITLRDGSFLKLQQGRAPGGKQGYQGPWRETLLRPSSFLSSVSLSRFFKSNPSSQSTSNSILGSSTNEILSLTTFLQGDGPALAFIISRDRKLKIWNLVNENCVKTLELPSRLESSSSQESVFTGSSEEEASNSLFNPNSSKPSIKIFNLVEESCLLLLAFIPSGLPHGDFFSLYEVKLDGSSGFGANASNGGIGEIILRWQEKCPETSDLNLVDMMIKPFKGGEAWKVDSLWESSEGSTLKTILLDEVYQTIDDEAFSRSRDVSAEADGDGQVRTISNPWKTVSLNSTDYKPLHGQIFEQDLTLASQDSDLGSFFLERILEPSRFLISSLEAGIEVYERDLKKDWKVSKGKEHHPLGLFKDSDNALNKYDDPQNQRSKVIEKISSLVGCSVQLEIDPSTGLPLYSEVKAKVLKEWIRFVSLIESFENQARFPLGLCSMEVGINNQIELEPIIFTREMLITTSREDGPMLVDRISKVLGKNPENEVGREKERAVRKNELARKEIETLLEEEMGSGHDERRFSNNQNSNLKTISPILASSSSSSSTSIFKLAELFSSFYSSIANHSSTSLNKILLVELPRFLSNPIDSAEDACHDLWEESLAGSIPEDHQQEFERRTLELGNDGDLEDGLWRFLEFLKESKGDLPGFNSSSEGSTSTSNQTQISRSELGSSLTSNLVIQSIYSRISLSQQFILFLITLNATTNPDLMELVPSIPSLLAQSSNLYHSLNLLIKLASITSESSETLPINILVGGEMNEADAVISKLGRLSVGGLDSKSENLEKLHALTSNLIHLSINKRLVSVGKKESQDEDLEIELKEFCDQNGHPSSSDKFFEASNHLLTLSGLLGVSSPSGSRIGSPPSLNAVLARLALEFLNLGFPSAAILIAKHFKMESASHFLVGDALVALGEFDEAAEEFHKVLAGLVQIEDADEDEVQVQDSNHQVLQSVLPTTVKNLTNGHDRKTAFYLHLADTFEVSGSQKQIVEFSSLTIASASSSISSKLLSNSKLLTLYFRLFRSQISLGDYAGAYGTIYDAPSSPALFADFKKESVGRLVSVMTEQGAVSELLEFSFPGLQSQVETTLAFKARNCNPLERPNFWRVLYAYYIERGDLKTAGMVMYQQARRLGDEQRIGILSNGRNQISNQKLAQQYVELSQLQAFSYLAAINALSLLSEKDSWFANAVQQNEPGQHLGMDVDEDEDQNAYQRQRNNKGTNKNKKLKSYIPDHHLQHAKVDLRPVTIGDVRREYELVMVRLELVRRFPELTSTAFALGPSDAVSFFVRDGSYDRAIATAYSLGVDMSTVFLTLTTKCVALERSYKERKAALISALQPSSNSTPSTTLHPSMTLTLEEELELELQDHEDELEDSDPDAIDTSFLKTSERLLLVEGPQYLKAWEYLKYHLEIQDGENHAEYGDRREESFKYRELVLNRILALQGVESNQMIPRWLIDWFKENRMDSLVKSFLKVGLVDDALSYAIDMVKNTSTKCSPSGISTRVKTTWLPYNLLDELVLIAEDPETRPSSGSPSATKTRELANQLKKEISNRVGKLEKETRGIRRNFEEDRRMEQRREDAMEE